MQEKIRLIIIMVIAAMLAASAFVGLKTYTSKRAIELERNSLRNENENLTAKIDGIIKERSQLQEKANALSNDLDKAVKEKEDIQKQYALIVKERNELVDKVKGLQRNNEQLRADLSNLSREKQRPGQNWETNLAPLRDENAQLKQQLDNLNSLKSKLESELGQLKGEKSDLEQKLDQIDSFLEQQLTRLRYLSLKEQLDAIRAGGAPETETVESTQSEKESVELPPIVVLSQTLSKPQTPLLQKRGTPVKPTGAVLEVNKENKFVIIDLGQDAGIKLGDAFKVYRQGNPIATVEVIQVRQSISACDIKEELMPIGAGDIVR